MSTNPKIKDANLFQISGDGIQLTYTTNGFDGKPHFSYHDAHQSKTFTGEQIRETKTEIGTLVSVVLNQSVDVGSTSFTLVIPTLSLGLLDSINISTNGITTLHKLSIFGTPNGQTDFYTIQPLQGTAAHAVF